MLSQFCKPRLPPEPETSQKPFKVFVCHPEISREALELMEENCDLIIIESLPPDRVEILKKVKGVHGMIWCAHFTLNAQVLDAAGPQLKTVCTLSTGFNHIDVEELKRRKITLAHTPEIMKHAVADVGIGLMIAAARRFHEGRLKVDAGDWQKAHITWLFGQDISDAVVGFYGFGNIGQAIAQRLQGFNVSSILYTTRRRILRESERQLKAKKVPFDNLITDSDILFIALPLTSETENTINAEVFCKMKPTAVLINISRGKVVNQEDLYEALKSGEIFSAGVDVLTSEPPAEDEPLLTLPNCVITPHIGPSTERTHVKVATLAVYNVLRGLIDQPLKTPVYSLKDDKEREERRKVRLERKKDEDENESSKEESEKPQSPEN